MEFIVIYKEKHYLVKDSSQVSATIQAFNLAQKDFGIESADFTDFTVIRPTEFITIYGEYIDMEKKTITYNGITYRLDDSDYKMTTGFFLKPICKAKTIYYYNGTRYEITKD